MYRKTITAAATVPADKTARDAIAAKIISDRGLIGAPPETDAAIDFGVKIALDWLAVAQRPAVAGVTTGEQVQA